MAKKEKDSFLIYYEWEDVLNELKDSQAGKLIRALFAYEKRGEVYEGNDQKIKMAFRFMQGALDRNMDKYRRTCERNRRNISKRWEHTKNTSGKSGIPNDTKNTDHEHEHDRDHDHDPDHDHDHDREHEHDHDHERDAHAVRFADGSLGESEDVEALVFELEQNAGIPVDAKAMSELMRWYRKYGYEYVRLLCEEAMVHKADSFGYLVTVLKRWKKDGLETVEQVLTSIEQG